MCGIVGYVGDKECNKILYDGLKMLEYRGYDSVGIATVDKGGFNIIKKKGRVATIEQDCLTLKGTVGIGHTRWATHGNPSDNNSHPHISQHFAVVHNGIIENYLDLKIGLVNRGVHFNSQTDTEVIVHTIEKNYTGNFLQAVTKSLKELIGSFAIAVMCKDYPNEIIVAKKDNPVLIGEKDGEYFIASDIPAIAEHTDNIYYLEDEEISIIEKNKISFFSFDGHKIIKNSKKIDIEKNQLGMSGYESYMLKEIHEIPSSVRKTAQSLKELQLPKECLDAFKNSDFIKIIGCGTAYNSGLVGKTLFEDQAKVRCDTEIASEFRYSNTLINNKTLVIAVSQSGETADTLAGVKLAKMLGAYVLLITNVPNSTITNYADYSIVTKAGQEIAVAATKSYCCQLVTFYYLAEQVALSRGIKVDLISKMDSLAEKIESVFSLDEQLIDLAQRYHTVQSVFFLGRILDYSVAVEASLKLKEISYIHSEGYAGGELKHGTLALIDENVLVVSLETQDKLLLKMENAVKEVEARGANIVIVTQYDSAHKDVVKLPVAEDIFMPLIEIVPLQLFAYYVSRCRGQDADKPRNLAKSVTVE